MIKVLEHWRSRLGKQAAQSARFTGAGQQVLVALCAAALALAVRSAVDPWLGDRHEFLPVYLAVAFATWMASWRAGTLASFVLFAGNEWIFGDPRSAADAGLVHMVLADVFYALACAIVVVAAHHAARMHRELEQRVVQLHASDHRKSDFIALLAHELRNPLSVLCTGTQLIRQGKLDQRAMDGAWRALERQTAHMKRIVGDVLDTSRVEQGKLALLREMVDIASLLRQGVADAETFTAAKHQQVQLVISGHPGYAYGDPQRLRQVLDNLLHNASKFSAAGAEITVALAWSASEIGISVRDSGIGIPTSELQSIFGSFVQVEPAGARSQGLGLGLALCKKLAEMHGGSIEARSAGTGCGSEFIVRLPRPPELATSAASAPAAESIDTEAVS